MSQNETNSNTGPKPNPEQGLTPPAQPAKNAPEGINAGEAKPIAAATPAATVPAAAAPAAPAKTETAVVKVNTYIPGGLNRDVVNPSTPNPSQSDQNFPFAAGHKMHEVVQSQNLFTFPLDTYYNVFDAVYYFSDEKNRNRYTYEQQQNIISRIVRAAIDFGVPIEGIREKLRI